jgi:hypothetical protein
VWIHHAAFRDFPQSSYETASQDAAEYWEFARREFPLPYHPNVSMGWDSTPRARQEDRFENAGYPFMPVLAGNTPARFKHALENARKFLESHPESPRILNLNSWNEWTEGSYLEPDTVNGLAYLEAVREVFPPSPLPL